MKWVFKSQKAVSVPRMGPWMSWAWTSVETKKVKKKWEVAGKNMKWTINILVQQICVKANIMLVTENNKSKEICS